MSGESARFVIIYMKKVVRLASLKTKIWESLQKRRKGNRIIVLQRSERETKNTTDDLIPGINTPWHFRFLQQVQMSPGKCLHIYSFSPDYIGMTSLVLRSPLLKCQILCV